MRQFAKMKKISPRENLWDVSYYQTKMYAFIIIKIKKHY